MPNCITVGIIAGIMVKLIDEGFGSTDGLKMLNRLVFKGPLYYSTLFHLPSRFIIFLSLASAEASHWE